MPTIIHNYQVCTRTLNRSRQRIPRAGLISGLNLRNNDSLLMIIMAPPHQERRDQIILPFPGLEQDVMFMRGESRP